MSEIRGIMMPVSGAELKTHFGGRITAHMNKAVDYAARAETMAKLQTEEANVVHGGIGTMMVNPVKELQQHAQRHRSKVTYFEFMAQHVQGGDTYLLTESDMIQLELIERQY